MPPHLRNGRNLSAKQQLRYQLSPAAEERLRRARIGFAAAGRGFSQSPTRGTAATGHRNTLGVVQSEGDVPGTGLQQIDSSTATSGAGADEFSRQSTNLPAYQPRGFTTGGATGLSPTSAHSEPSGGGFFRPNGNYTRRSRVDRPSEPVQRSIQSLRPSLGGAELEICENVPHASGHNARHD
ncbi:hypothetical protein PtB15_14B211 [Puccinia triticina]|nr:hypothetical protein PtB15_14B211 [Puccinia triticina]